MLNTRPLLQVLTLLKRHPAIIFWLCISIALVFIYLYSQHQDTATTTQNRAITNPKASIANLIPNSTTHQTIINQLGAPQTVYEMDGYTVYTYPSATAYYTPDQLFLKNDLLVLSETFFTPQQYPYPESRVISENGQPTTTYYLPYNPYMSVKVLFYVDQGLAVYINQDNHSAYRFHRFQPSFTTEYLQYWGKDFLSTAPSPPQSVDPHPHQ